MIERRLPMLEQVRKRITVASLPLEWLLSVTSVGSFTWLLLQNQIHPLAVYLLQLYLSF